MTQDQINVMLAMLPILIPLIQFLLTKFFGRGKDRVEYSSELLELANDATEQLRKSREEQIQLEENYEKTISLIRREHKAAIDSIREEYDARHAGLRNRISELEKVQKIYAIQFDLVTHPKLEVRNINARAMDDVTESQKTRAITTEQSKGEK